MIGVDFYLIHMLVALESRDSEGSFGRREKDSTEEII